MKNLSKFQIILLLVFAAFILIGVLIFSITGSKTTESAEVIVWGTIRKSDFNLLVKGISFGQDGDIKLTYKEINEGGFDEELVTALSEGRGPDVFFLPHSSILKNKKKIFEIPFSNYDQRTFKDTFVEGAEHYLTDTGVLALPFTIDPLVMYWNRDLFTNAGISQPPEYWDQFIGLVPLLTKKTSTFDITQSTAPLGEYANITNAKELISSIIMQAGNPITRKLPGGRASVTLSQKFGQPITPAFAALNFYTQFRDPTKSVYTWNRSLPDSQLFFLSNQLAVYFGLSSEYSQLKRKNPNLNFDVAPLPQLRDSQDRIVSGQINALAISRASRNIPAAFIVISALSSREGAIKFAGHFGTPPVRRDLLSIQTTDALSSITYRSAIQTRVWFDPDKDESDKILGEMIESVTGGRVGLNEAIDKAEKEIQDLINIK